MISPRHNPSPEDDLIFHEFMANHHRAITNGRTIEHAFQRMCRQIKDFSSWDKAEKESNLLIHNEYNRILRKFHYANRLPKAKHA